MLIVDLWFSRRSGETDTPRSSRNTQQPADAGGQNIRHRLQAAEPEREGLRKTSRGPNLNFD